MTTTFLGRRMAQSLFAIVVWEQVLSQLSFGRLVEFGTYRGAMSLYLLLYCKQRKKEFRTYDITDWKKLEKRPHLKLEIGLDKCFVQGDIFSKEAEIGELLGKKGQTILYCDGGNKAREAEVFGKYLKSGDILAVHDWNNEIFEEHIPYGFRKTFEDATRLDPLTAFFEKI